MELRHIPIDELRPAAINMRHGKRLPDIDDILPSIRVRGILQPLLVRPVEAEGNLYEIVAGRRRYFSAKAVKEEQGEVDPLPCAVMEPGDDAAALEASLIENIARLDPDGAPNDPKRSPEQHLFADPRGKMRSDSAVVGGDLFVPLSGTSR